MARSWNEGNRIRCSGTGSGECEKADCDARQSIAYQQVEIGSDIPLSATDFAQAFRESRADIGVRRSNEKDLGEKTGDLAQHSEERDFNPANPWVREK
jgi:hypothetical protein